MEEQKKNSGRKKMAIRTITMSFCLMPNEKEKIYRDAKASGKNLSKYILSKLLN